MSSGLVNHPYSLGDLPNLLVPKGRKGSLDSMTNRMTIFDGPTTLVDQDSTAFIIPESEDKYMPGLPSKDAPGGTRMAYGVIVDIPQ